MTYAPQEDPFYKGIKARDDTNQLERKMHIALREAIKPELKEDSELPQRGAGVEQYCKIIAYLASQTSSECPQRHPRHLCPDN